MYADPHQPFTFPSSVEAVDGPPHLEPWLVHLLSRTEFQKNSGSSEVHRSLVSWLFFPSASSENSADHGEVSPGGGLLPNPPSPPLALEC